MNAQHESQPKEQIPNISSQLRLFKAAVPLLGDERPDVYTLRELFDAGVVADPALFNGMDVPEQEELASWIIAEFGVELPKLNATFYKDFETVENLSDFQRLADQFLHYASTYGNAEFLRNSGSIYEPDAFTAAELESMLTFSKALVSLHAISNAELYEKVLTLLSSGVALSEQATADLIDVVTAFRFDLDLDSVKNKEFLCRFALATGSIPSNFDDAVRIAMFALTGRPLLIKSHVIYNGLSHSLDKEFPAEAVRAAASVVTDFHTLHPEIAEANAQRYRVFLMLLKKARADSDFSTLVNRLLRRTKSRYLPVQTPVISRVFSPETTEAELTKLAKTADNFQLVKLLNAANERLGMDESVSGAVYRIRHGKTFVKLTTTMPDKARAEMVSSLFETELRSRFAQKLNGNALVIPDDIDYALLTSAKASFGAVPLLSTIKTAGDVVVGIAWSKHADLDLHAVSPDDQLGWNAYFAKGGVTYSGDMTETNAHGFAAEYFRVTETKSPIVVSVTAYSTDGSPKIPFQFVVSQGARQRRSSKGIFDVFSDIRMLGTAEISQSETKTFVVIVPEHDNSHTVIFANPGAISGGRTPDVTRQRTLLSSLALKARTAMTIRKLAALIEVPVFSSMGEATEHGYYTDKVFHLDPLSLTDSTFVDLATMA